MIKDRFYELLNIIEYDIKNEEILIDYKHFINLQYELLMSTKHVEFFINFSYILYLKLIKQNINVGKILNLSLKLQKKHIKILKLREKI